MNIEEAIREDFDQRPPKPQHLDAHCEEDLVVAHIRGAYDVDVARYLEFLYVAQVKQYGYRAALLHTREMTTITPEARRLLSKWDAARRDPSAAAIVGASFTTKTVAQMLIRAIELMKKKPMNLDFFNSEAEARVWLDARRAKLKLSNAAKQ